MIIAPPWNTERLRTQLTTRQVGWPLLFYESIESTNTTALELARSGAASGTLLLAEEQTGGRGRRSRSWASARGAGIWMTLILKSLEHDPRNVLVSMICALSAAETLEKFAGLPAQVKWPNDIWLAGRKACGILVEASPASRMVVAGLGLNLYHQEQDFPAEVRPTAVSVYQVCGRKVDREQFLMDLLRSFEQKYAGASPATHDGIVAAYRTRSALIGRAVRVDGRVRGTAIDISREGELVVRTPSGETIALVDGEVRLADDGQQENTSITNTI